MVSNYQIYSTIISYIMFGIIGLWFAYDRYFRRFTRINIYKQNNSVWYLLHSKKLKTKIELYKYKDKDYIIDLSQSSIDARNRVTLNYDVDKANPINFGISTDNKVNSSLLSKILTQKKVHDLVSSERETEFIVIIVILIICLLAVGLFSIYKISEMNTQLQKLLLEIKGIVM